MKYDMKWYWLRWVWCWAELATTLVAVCTLGFCQPRWGMVASHRFLNHAEKNIAEGGE